jgi:hypothetical protein
MLSNEYCGFYDYNKAKLFKKHIVANKNGYFDELFHLSSNEQSNDQNGFVSKETETMKFDTNNQALFESQIRFENSMILPIEYDHWLNLQEFRYFSSKREKFNQKFNKIFNQMIRSNGIKCFLICDHNYFNLKHNSNYWSGRYRCSSRDCEIKFHANIKKIIPEHTVEVFIGWNGKCNHDAISKNISCSGEQRKQMQHNLMAKGIANVRNENFLHNLKDDERNYYIYYLYYNF